MDYLHSNVSAKLASAVVAVDEAITSRRSIRAFLSRPVAREDIEAILRVASRAPSGSNIQPWKVHVLMGEPKNRLTDALVEAFGDPEQVNRHVENYSYYPRTWVEPYQSRRRKVGFDLYGLLGIGKADQDRMHTQHARNYHFFDAPVGLIFTIDRLMEQGSWLDYGMFLQAVMTAARARGLDTCPQAAFNRFHRIVGERLGLPADQALVCGMALGYADPHAIENSLATERAELKEFVRFCT
jgi:nitroreductase